MAKFLRSEALDQAAKTKDLSEISDSSCTTGYDNDGSTGFDIFENGFDLAKKAGDNDVWVLYQGNNADTAYFFWGYRDEAELLQAISECSEDPDADEDGDEDEGE